MPIDSAKKLSLKRKLKASSTASRKKIKVGAQLEDLPWKSVPRPVETGFGGDDGILELEEVDNVEVYYEATEAGRIAKFKVIENANEEGRGVQKEDVEDNMDEQDDESQEEAFDSETLLPEWHSFSLNPKITRALHTKGFSEPTPIQKQAIPLALQGRDLVGVAQTGSGKTLAYGLPILHHLLSQKAPSRKLRRPLRALILAPTRELALQVSTHLNEILKANDTQVPQPYTKSPPHVSIAAVVGGMSAQKQKRILDRGADVLVATPGRLWDILSTDDELAYQIKNLKFLVLDEADRMIETGHYAEMENILRLTLREKSSDQIPEEGEEQDQDPTTSDKEPIDLQTFVFSATFSKDLQHNLKKPKPTFNKKKRNEPTTTLDDLLERLDFRDPAPEVIDLSPKSGVVSTLQEGRINCLLADKDVYLFYFLLRHPGRSLVFLSAIDGIRRLAPLLDLLEIKVFPLHSQMEQKQRLKNLDRFKTTPNSVLLATDIAARGLDIPSVDHVIHFQIPRSADTYIHRNGRTARANREGFSMLMCAPDERRVVKALLGKLGRDEAEIPEMDMELSLLDKLKERVRLAREIEGMQHKVKRGNFEKNWMKEAADAMEIELDSDFYSDEESTNDLKRENKNRAIKLAKLKAELKHRLSEPLIARGVLAKYITSGSRPIVDDLLAGQLNPTMIGVRQIEAREEVKTQKSAEAKKKQKKDKNDSQ